MLVPKTQLIVTSNSK